MSLFDLLFIPLFLAACATLGAATVAALRGRRAASRTLLRRLGLAIAAYLGIVAVVSLLSPRRYVRLGQAQCSDDWCIAVTSVRRPPEARGTALEVTFRLSSRARRVAQRERFVVAYLRDARGRRYDPDPSLTDPPFDVRLEPQQAVTTTRRFTVPADAPDLGLVVAREGDFPLPGCCIIGDDGSLFHKKTVVRLK
jgi:hypothetical protein